MTETSFKDLKAGDVVRISNHWVGQLAENPECVQYKWHIEFLYSFTLTNEKDKLLMGNKITTGGRTSCELVDEDHWTYKHLHNLISGNHEADPEVTAPSKEDPGSLQDYLNDAQEKEAQQQPADHPDPGKIDENFMYPFSGDKQKIDFMSLEDLPGWKPVDPEDLPGFNVMDSVIQEMKQFIRKHPGAETRIIISGEKITIEQVVTP